MTNAIGWIIVAWIVSVVGKEVAKKIWPEDWE